IDYFGRWKALQYMARRFFAPVAASFLKEEKRFSLFVENETAFPVNWEGEILLKNMDCEVLEKVTVRGCTEEFTSEKIAEMDITQISSGKPMEWEERVFSEANVRFEDGNVVKQVETLLPYKYLDLKKPEIEVQVQEKEDAYILQVTSDVFAPFVELDFEDADVIFSDNYFHLTGEMREVVLRKKDIRNGNFKDSMELKERLRVRSLM
ncbi:MAG: glycoside hydrolase family 2 protein, partial [Bariatricus sp.]